jgi:hypothetical protein
MPSSLSLSLIGGLAAAGVGAGLYLGQAAIAEIDPIYFQDPPTRFHADLSPARAGDSAPRPLLASAAEAPVASCVGCRTYPEELYPIHSASLGRYASDYAEADRPAVTAEAEIEPAPDPERLRLTRDIERVATYARGSTPDVAYASAEALPQEAAGAISAPADE